MGEEDVVQISESRMDGGLIKAILAGRFICAAILFNTFIPTGRAFIATFSRREKQRLNSLPKVTQ